MVLNQHHADIQPLYDAIPYYWDMCNVAEKRHKSLLPHLFHSLVARVTQFLSM
jgi:hypothetical protein